EGFLDELLARLTLQAIDTAEARPTRPSGIRFGMLGIRGQGDELEETAPVPTATLGLSLGDEAETIRWLHDEISGGQGLPLAEAEAVVRALSVAMHGDQEMMVPLLQLRNFDEYTTTHSLNVSVLA
ncbi:MAG: hypothetical protein GTO30_13355, partial [Acidobacteria bacterium]|nr:hypothetical protein [Acidobacteriota bacterium]